MILEESLRNVARLGVKTIRRCMGERCKLPSVIVIGAQKASTSSLHRYMKQHPNLSGALGKEVHYFDSPNYRKGLAWYRSHFAPHADDDKVNLNYEATPRYIVDPRVPERIHKDLPDVRLIAVLRNPTDRAISHCFHTVRNKQVPGVTLDVFQSEEDRLRDIIANEDYDNEDFAIYSYKLRGHYREQLERYDQFFPKEQMLIMSAKELSKDMQNSMNRIFDFIGVRHFDIPNTRPHNVGSNRKDVDPKVREYLDDYFKPYNEALFEYLGRELDW